jgi:hypothetical protein
MMGALGAGIAVVATEGRFPALDSWCLDSVFTWSLADSGAEIKSDSFCFEDGAPNGDFRLVFVIACPLVIFRETCRSTLGPAMAR